MAGARSGSRSPPARSPGSARELHRRLGKLRRPLAKVGSQLDSAVNAYNDAVGSFDHRVVPQLRSIEQAGVASEREIPAPAAIETDRAPVTARLESEPGDSPLDRAELDQPSRRRCPTSELIAAGAQAPRRSA